MNCLSLVWSSNIYLKFFILIGSKIEKLLMIKRLNTFFWEFCLLGGTFSDFLLSNPISCCQIILQKDFLFIDILLFYKKSHHRIQRFMIGKININIIIHKNLNFLLINCLVQYPIIPNWSFLDIIWSRFSIIFVSWKEVYWMLVIGTQMTMSSKVLFVFLK